MYEEDDYGGGVKAPPHSIEAEQSVIGALLIDPESADQVMEAVAAEDFYERRHRLIFQTISNMLNAGRVVDAVTVSETLQDHEHLADAGGVQYLLLLANETPSAANVLAYARIVRERATLRQLIRVGREIAELAYRPDGREARMLLDEAESRVFQLAEGQQRAGKGFVQLKEALPAVIDRIEAVARDKKGVTGLATGFADLDEKTSGLHPGQLVIVAGRPSMGKTSFAMNVAEHVACVEGKNVLVFSMEMPTDEIVLRALSSRGRVDQHRLRNGTLGNDDWPRLAHAIGELGTAPLFADDSAALSPADLRSRARRLKREQGLDLIVVDYLQLMQVPGRGDNRVAEISEISRSLKALAKELSIPVIALSQLNRSLENRTEKRPQMSDLRESGAIEQDADLILFLYRDEVYNKDNEEVKGIAEVIIGKQRNGPIGTVRMSFFGEYTRFENYAPTGGEYGH
ncbi:MULTISPECIES: replicative DNA helicase [Acidithiobacillus]|uniref:Replicative DNA helicase n=3 Tax=Acidithiobacillus thiooxidans TaxID=930 RepID=A0A1C2J8K3_ACITH|nr:MULTISPECIES: replicative DNA helicase [Acidithiobacillus]MBE7566520.1 replicative DNA helicase [Acidithiobacillus sp. HP-11]MBU2749742.1 replicative DNA helicase [Acidithiobacillus thiooxidans]OCX74306.1 replicative DNA helicase [Acidithiobacillus thiooxidans]OCX75440.1 replicative DNA helicase [Acidithiobacillus thiooxidans]OCX78383.1 replicative DNA helicase [Acidithiobacillus thiooxidans]